MRLTFIDTLLTVNVDGWVGVYGWGCWVDGWMDGWMDKWMDGWMDMQDIQH